MKAREILTIALTNRVLFAIEKVVKLHSTVKGLENIPQNSSIIFTPNHFTRCETFIVPYLLNQAPHLKFCRSLAFSSLFTSYLGKYLTNLKTLSTSDENRDEIITNSLANGEDNWVIYPEGMMVKDRKREVKHGILETKLSVKTGTSVIAIKAECVRAKNNLNTNPVCIIPVTINYTPLHPDANNKILKIAQKFIKKLPKRLEEELTVEGSLLLNSHITLELHKPIFIKDYTQEESHLSNFLGIKNKKSVEDNISQHRLPISAKIADEIYKHTHITYEHIVCAILEEMKIVEIAKIPFLVIACVQALKQYSNILRYEGDLSDSTILQGILNTEKLNHFIALLQEQQCVESDGFSIATTEKFHTYTDFDYIRIQNVAKVFLNELYYFKNVQYTIKSATLQSDFNTMLQCFKYIDEIYLRTHEITKSQHSIDTKHGIAKFTKAPSDRVCLLIHGYKSSPFEMGEIASEIASSGISSYCVRMEGHGTSPFDMATTTRKQWQDSCEIAYKILSLHFKRIDICGFSTGGLIALNLSLKYPAVRSLTAINPALKLCDVKFRLVKVANLWSEALEKIANSKKKYITDAPAYPKTNYAINHFSCMSELSTLMSEVAEVLPKVKVDILIINSTKDPVVLPKSSKEIFDAVSSNVRYLEEVESDEHVIVRGKSAKEVSSLIKKFLF